ncbi:hypothetical protein [Methanobrevibacter sp.]|uniref:hypothetical protein n=1 Tax=Methanobrevibacter sp. TaxID=66852 RepID=UPI00386BA6AE
MIDLNATIKNIRAACDNYMDPNLLVFIIHDDNAMGTNNILEIDAYDIRREDSYEERILKIHHHENIFIACGMMTFLPIINECDIFSDNDFNLTMIQEEFDLYCDREEKLFGILVKKCSKEYIIGKTDVCNCSVDACFEKIEKSESKFFKMIEEIIEGKIIYQ